MNTVYYKQPERLAHVLGASLDMINFGRGEAFLKDQSFCCLLLFFLKKSSVIGKMIKVLKKVLFLLKMNFFFYHK